MAGLRSGGHDDSAVGSEGFQITKGHPGTSYSDSLLLGFQPSDFLFGMLLKLCFELGVGQRIARQ